MSVKKTFAAAPQMAILFAAIFVLPSYTSANPVCKCREPGSPSKKVVDFNVHVKEAGEKYNEKIEVDTDKQTELFQVPSHPGVDRSDVLHDFKQNLTMYRLPDSKICYLFPLVNGQSMPEKLIRDLDKANKMVVTKIRRVDSTWMTDGEVTDRSVLSDELAQLCAKYPIYHVKETRDSLSTTRLQTEDSTNRKRRQSGMSKLCRGGMNYVDALNYCQSIPKLRCKYIGRTCYKYVICDVGYGPGDKPPPHLTRMQVNSVHINSAGDLCWEDHIYRNIVCCEYICNTEHTAPII